MSRRFWVEANADGDPAIWTDGKDSRHPEEVGYYLPAMSGWAFHVPPPRKKAAFTPADLRGIAAAIDEHEEYLAEVETRSTL